MNIFFSLRRAYRIDYKTCSNSKLKNPKGRIRPETACT